MTLRVVHYVNQFFAGLGAEEKAGMAPGMQAGAVGAGRALQQVLGENGQVVATLFCGDNYFAENPEQATAELLGFLAAQHAQLLIAGPAFESGRYGVACGALCAAAQEQLGIPAVASMDADNAGADIYHRNVYIVPSGSAATQMLPVLQRVAQLGLKLAAGEPLGSPAQEGYLPRGIARVGFAEIPAAERVVDMLLAKLRGDPFETEILPHKFEHAPAAPPVRELASAHIALVTDGGLVPEGNPDHMESAGGRRFSALPIAGLDELNPDDFDVYHSGCDTTYTNRDPHRLVPLDVMRELEREGRFGRLHEYVYSTAGIGADVPSSTRTGQGIAERLKAAGVEGVILTST
jgi:glycine reductase complex component B subunit gamma